jgi:hypothetical protein
MLKLICTAILINSIGWENVARSNTLFPVNFCNEAGNICLAYIKPRGYSGQIRGIRILTFLPRKN